MAIDRREFIRMTAASAAGLTITGATVRFASAAPLTVGVLIPGSKSDKGWMESGYDGLKAAEKRHGDKIKVTYVENVKFADMEQALVTLATKNVLVIGVGGQTEASVRKVAKRFPKVKFSVVAAIAAPRTTTSRSTTCARPRSPSWPAPRRPCCPRTAPSATSAGWRSRPS